MNHNKVFPFRIYTLFDDTIESIVNVNDNSRLCVGKVFVCVGNSHVNGIYLCTKLGLVVRTKSDSSWTVDWSCSCITDRYKVGEPYDIRIFGRRIYKDHFGQIPVKKGRERFFLYASIVNDAKVFLDKTLSDTKSKVDLLEKLLGEFVRDDKIG